MALILVRHSRPLGGEGLCYGRTDLPPGPEVAEDALRIAASVPEVGRIVTSPLVRAARLAEALAEALALPLQSDARLAEMDFGAWEGRRWDDIPRAELDAWAADFEHARPHGGESVAMLADRAEAALAACDGALVVTHMGIIRAALARTGHADPWQAKVGFAETVIL